jgi:SAM-dependent methyltransferase
MAGRGAAVTAVDIDTRFIEHMASDNVDIHCLDIRTDALPTGEFDLVHTRLVLEHLSDRQQILDRLAATLRPGGWIVIEAFDWNYFSWESGVPALNAMSKAVLDYAEQVGGLDTSYGRRLLTALNQAGLTDVRGQGRAHVIDGYCPGFDFFKLTIDSLRRPLIDIGAISKAEAEMADARLHDKHLRINTPMMMAGIGRRGHVGG